MRTFVYALLSITLLTCLISPPSGALATGKHGHQSTSKPSAAVLLSRHMVSALSNESHIKVTGAARAGKLVTHVLFRYQSGQREFLQKTGGAYASVAVGNHRNAGFRQIVLGRHVYTSVNGSHWLSQTQSSPASPLDALRFNAAALPCCVGGGKGSLVRLTDRGLRSWKGKAVYALGFQVLGAGQVATGTLLIDKSTYLPLRYTETAHPHPSPGTFTITYGGSFTIKAPK